MLITNKVTVGRAQTRTLQGRTYAVCPVSMLVPGIVNGSRGPLYYSEEEIKKTINAWNGKPVVVYHPRSSEGQPLSARQPDTMEHYGVGTIYNTKYDPVKKRLVAEAWIDVGLAEKLDDRVLLAINEQKPMECSTGLDASTRDMGKSVIYNGLEARLEVFNLQPDHLALLPDVKGACSVEAGCGLMVNQEGEQEGETGGIPTKVVEIDGREISVHLINNEMSHEQLHDMLRKLIRAKFTQDDPNVWVRDVFDTFIIYSQQGVLFKQGYSKTDSGVSLSSVPPQMVMEEISFKPVTLTVNEEEKSMKKKEKLVGQLITNSDIWTEEDRETLMSFDEEKVEALVTNLQTSLGNEAIANQVKKGIKVADSTLVLNDSGEFKLDKPVQTVIAQADPAPVQNCGGQEPKKQEPLTVENWIEQLKTAPPEIQELMSTSARITQREKQDLTTQILNAVGGGDDYAKQLQGLSIPQLENQVQMAKAIQNNVAKTLLQSQGKKVSDNENVVDYLAAAGAPTIFNEQVEEEGLDLPVYSIKAS